MGITVTGGVHFFVCMFGVLGNYSYLCTGLRNTAFRLATEFKSYSNGIIIKSRQKTTRSSAAWMNGAW